MISYLYIRYILFIFVTATVFLLSLWEHTNLTRFLKAQWWSSQEKTPVAEWQIPNKTRGMVMHTELFDNHSYLVIFRVFVESEVLGAK